ncbi:hypothetical protein D3C80_1462340 [compost metagenome]
MIKYIVLGLIFAVSFLLFTTGIQIGLGMLMTKEYVPNMTNAYEITAADTVRSRVDFGIHPFWFSTQNIIVWLVSLGISSGIVFSVHKYAFNK